MSQSKTDTQDTNIAVDQVQEVVAGSGQRADALRADGFVALTDVKRAKLVQTRRERARVAERHGEDSEHVAKLDRQMATEHSFLVGSRVESARLDTPMIERKKGVWQLHGYLRNPDGFPHERYSVGVFPDPEGIESPLLTATTNSAGYFHMRWQPPKKKKAATGDPDAPDPSDSELVEEALGNPLYLGARGGKQPIPTMDPRPLHPMPGIIVYRDMIVKDDAGDGSDCHLATRLLGNSSTRELHTLDNEQANCQLAAMRPDHRVYFQSEAQAEKLGYDYCAHCYGKGRSKR